MPRMIHVFVEQLDQMLTRALEGWACQGSTKTHNCLQPQERHSLDFAGESARMIAVVLRFLLRVSKRPSNARRIQSPSRLRDNDSQEPPWRSVWPGTKREPEDAEEGIGKA